MSIPYLAGCSPRDGIGGQKRSPRYEVSAPRLSIRFCTSDRGCLDRRAFLEVA